MLSNNNLNLDSLNSAGFIDSNTGNTDNNGMNSPSNYNNDVYNLDIIQDISTGDSGSAADTTVEDSNKDSLDIEDNKSDSDPNSDPNSGSGSGSGFLKIVKANNVGGHHQKIKVDHEKQKVDAYDSSKMKK